MATWQDYVDKQLVGTNFISKACITGHDGNTWAKSEGFDVSPDEAKRVLAGFDNTDPLTSNGITVAGKRYIFLSAEPGKVLRAKQGKQGLHCVKTVQTVVIAVYEDPVQPQQAATVVEGLGEYLAGQNY